MALNVAVNPQRHVNVAPVADGHTPCEESDEEDGHTELRRGKPASYTAPVGASLPRNNSPASVTTPLSKPKSKAQNGQANSDYIVPKPLDPAEAGTDLELNSMVEVSGNPEYCRYGIIRWIGYMREKSKPIAGLEMVSSSRILSMILYVQQNKQP